MKTKALVALLAFAALAIAQTGANYSPTEAAKHVGEAAMVTGRVDGVYQARASAIYLSMGGIFPNQAFTVFIPFTSAPQFSNPQQYKGRTVSVAGKIRLVRGKPEIVVTSPSQIAAR
jgi:hypothetical protein